MTTPAHGDVGTSWVRADEVDEDLGDFELERGDQIRRMAFT